jgi:DNA-binding GntR family transcriptional regulator
MGAQLSPIVKWALPRSATDSLRSAIVTGQLRPGERLVERDIAERFGISRTPVREAFFQLQRDGLATTGQGRGLFVSFLCEAEITRIYQILGGLERIAVRHTEKASAEMLSRLRKATAKRRRAGGDIERIIAADIAWHQALTDSTSNLKVLDLLGAPRALAERYERAFFRAKANQERSTREHEEIQELVEAGDLRTAADLVEDHWLDNIRPMASALRKKRAEAGQ